MHDVDNDEDGSARDCDKVTMRMMMMMMMDDDDEVEDGRGDEVQVNSCAMCILCDKNEEDNEDGVDINEPC